MPRMRYTYFDIDFVVKGSVIAVQEACQETWKPQGNFRGQHQFSPQSFLVFDESDDDWDDY